MARAANLAEDVLQSIAGQVGLLLSGVFEPERLRQATVEIMREAIEVWLLETDAITAPTNDMRVLARPMGRLHHQIVVDGEVHAYARSTHLGADPSSWRVTEVFRSELAGKIEEAIRRPDLKVFDDWLVRLMIVPAYQTHAFWFLSDAGESQVFVIDCPPMFMRLSPNQLLGQEDFFDALRGEQHIVGRFRS